MSSLGESVYLKNAILFLMSISTIALPQVAMGDDVADHKHTAMTVRSRPVIERVPLKVIDPVDVIVTQFGDTLIADRIGKVVFRVDAMQETSAIARELTDISRIADSRMMGTHVLQAGHGSGRVIRVTETGFQTEFLHLPFTPAGLAVDEVGNLWTSNAALGRLFLFGSDGQRKFAFALSESIKDLTSGLNGSVVVLLKSGKLVTVFPNETSLAAGYVPASASRLSFHPEGFVVALAHDADGKSVLVKATQALGNTDRFAGLIGGTVAVAFDKLGNLTLANPDLRAITRVTSHFQVPCPHCGILVPLVFCPDAPAAEQATRRSF